MMLSVAVAGLVWRGVAAGGAAAAGGGRPNFLIYQPDDMTYFWDDAPPRSDPDAPTFPTPHLDALRNESLVFTRAYVTTSTCAPSRIATLTGRFPSRNAWGVSLGDSFLSPGDPSCEMTDVNVANCKFYAGDCGDNAAVALGDAGYATGVVGKWHLNRKPHYGDRGTQCGNQNVQDTFNMVQFERIWGARSARPRDLVQR